MSYCICASADVSGHIVSMSNGSGIPGGNYKEIKGVIGTLDDCCSVAGFKLEITDDEFLLVEQTNKHRILTIWARDPKRKKRENIMDGWQEEQVSY